MEKKEFKLDIDNIDLHLVEFNEKYKDILTIPIAILPYGKRFNLSYDKQKETKDN